MKTKNLIFFLAVFTLALIVLSGNVQSSSVGISSWFGSTDSNSYTINNGDSTIIGIFAQSSLDPGARVFVEVDDSNGNPVFSLVDNAPLVQQNSYFSSYASGDLPIDQSVYQNPGTYTIISRIVGSDGTVAYATPNLTLIVNRAQHSPTPSPAPPAPTPVPPALPAPTAADVTSPTITITAPANGATLTSQATSISYTATDNVDGVVSCWYSLNGGITNSTKDPTCSSFTGLTSNQGSNTWIVYAQDNSGNIGSATTTFTVNISNNPSGPSGCTGLSCGSTSGNNNNNPNNYVYNDINAQAYAQQNQPQTSPTIDLTQQTPVVSQSWFSALIQAIINFFKSLFGL